MKWMKVGALAIASLVMLGCQSNGDGQSQAQETYNESAADRYMSQLYTKAERIIEREDGVISRNGDQITILLDGDRSFDYNSAYIRSDSHKVLSALSALIAKNEKSKVFIGGHTDSLGRDEYNRSLSDKRAKSVSNYLTLRGVDKEQVNTYGFGEVSPIADNDTASGRQKNRRIDIRITPNLDEF
ncbi:OmpA family protein [Photobacterium sanguinicancri]|uniref:OmpA family protein n=1 Tax=Photobacterium sanguinicancri TaxID=875932 RepID=A0AAW7Y3J2_9GAMM|nr:OmpA family protein [Photobacterium sanguinicancri]KXI22003.1 hypothetical protein AS132_16535 [Photobacterium sanguinicancri]MDO6499931.1 OmpA family protein [Photobacterium sanguinicancri]MDO6542932.1 OmpA family protein [Photobacterium sanguinicancri]OZS42755.1 OmpA family protein [Photobacterium sanguinicancri]